MSDWLTGRSGYGQMEEPSRYMTAEVCLNGHSTTDDVESCPELTSPFCPTCGSKTIRACANCNTPIRGRYHVPGVVGVFGYTPPNFCHRCGRPFPWTQAKLEAAKEHAAELDGLDETEKSQLQGAIEDLATGGARTELAASRFKRLMRKAGQQAGSGLYKFVIDVVSETAKKALTG